MEGNAEAGDGFKGKCYGFLKDAKQDFKSLRQTLQNYFRKEF